MRIGFPWNHLLMKLISWNVNGIRAALKGDLVSMIETEAPDILCLQETKANQDQVDHAFPEEYRQIWNSAERKGYSGTAVFTKHEPESVDFGIGLPEDNEGRVITCEFKDFYLVNCYTVNAKRDLSRLPFRSEVWDVAFLEHVKRLEESKPVVFCGDFNVAHKEIDLARPKGNVRNAGFTVEERRGFDNIVEAGFIDTFREFNTDGEHYTWWSYMNQARSRNIGWRIDYFCISSALRPHLLDAFILPDVMGSDHCPVGIVLK